jgi:hypothetical protein
MLSAKEEAMEQKHVSFVHQKPEDLYAASCTHQISNFPSGLLIRMFVRQPDTLVVRSTKR